MDEGKRMNVAEWMRNRMSDGQRFLVLCVVAGFLCGLAAVAFHLAIHHLFHSLWSFASGRGALEFAVIMIASPTLAGLLVGLAVRFLAPDAAGTPPPALPPPAGPPP